MRRVLLFQSFASYHGYHADGRRASEVVQVFEHGQERRADPAANERERCRRKCGEDRHARGPARPPDGDFA